MNNGRYVPTVPQTLTPAQSEMLDIMAEEVGEIVEVAGKIIRLKGKSDRFGIDDHSPFDPDKISNRQALETEVAHMLCAVKKLVENGVFSADRIAEEIAKKEEKLKLWTLSQNTDVPCLPSSENPIIEN